MFFHYPSSCNLFQKHEMKYISCLSGQSRVLCVFDESLERLFKVIFPEKERAASKKERNSCGWLSQLPSCSDVPEVSLALAEGPQGGRWHCETVTAAVRFPSLRHREGSAEVSSHQRVSPLHSPVISPAPEGQVCFFSALLWSHTCKFRREIR